MGKWFTCLLLGFFFVDSALVDDSLGVIHKTVSEVELTVIATDRSGRPVLHLSPEEVSVKEDGVPVRNFDLRSGSDLPLQVGIVLDLSGSMQRSWPMIRRVLSQSLGEILRPDDQVLLFAFDNHIKMEKVLASPQALDLMEIPKGGGLTALYDALYTACNQRMFLGSGTLRRAALVVFSDGEDNLSRHDLTESVDSAEGAGVAVYSISIHNHQQHNGGDQVLTEMTSATGGRSFIAASDNELASALDAIKDELRGSYLLYYRSPSALNRKFRRVELLPTEPNGISLRSRAGYYPMRP